jgi:hypothetical protein
VFTVQRLAWRGGRQALRQAHHDKASIASGRRLLGPSALGLAASEVARSIHGE